MTIGFQDIHSELLKVTLFMLLLVASIPETFRLVLEECSWF